MDKNIVEDTYVYVQILATFLLHIYKKNKENLQLNRCFI